MPSPFLILELALQRRPDVPASSSTGYALGGAYLVELDERARRLASERWSVGDSDARARAFRGEAELLRALAERLARVDCLVTSGGRQLELPVIEALALRHGITLEGHFRADDPYSARRSPYATARHLDLVSYLADGDRRLRSLPLEALLALHCQGAPSLAPRSLERESLDDARARALATYVLFLRVQRLRGRLSADELALRVGELTASGLEPPLLARLERLSFLGEPAMPARTLVDDFPDGSLLAFDIETVVDREGLSAALGRPIESDAEVALALEELSGGSSDFPPAPFHRVVAIAMVACDLTGGRLEIERLGLGSTSLGGGALPDERALLAAFWRAAKGKRLASYNGRRFDLPVLFYRGLPHPGELAWYLADRRPPSEQYRHPASVHQLDLFERLSGGLSPGKLGELLQSIGLPGKTGTDGGDVARLWAEGRRDEIADYCLSDAAQTFLLALRYLTISGEIDGATERRWALAAKARFEREPALREIVLRGAPFFDEGTA
ncbi:MAG: hypothetical protein ACYCWW_21025 [Deltaproteobacteria bacterium]